MEQEASDSGWRRMMCRTSFWWDRFNTSVYAPKGALMPLDDYVAKDSLDMGQFYERQ